MSVFIFLICITATAVGAISGIGGGVIIKPVLDAVSGLPVAAISFLSGCTVLSMSVVSLITSRGDKTVTINAKQGTLLAAGAAFGGVAGKEIFDIIKRGFGNDALLGVIQSVIMIMLTAGVFVYVLLKEKIRTKDVKNIFGCIAIGLVLGLLSAFLGIGGGPINLAVLYFFFSMNTKTAALNSIYIIFFSQISSFASTFLRNAVPEFEWHILILMIIGGVAGGFIGRSFSKRMSGHSVDILFKLLLIAITLLSIYNTAAYAAKL